MYNFFKKLKMKLLNKKILEISKANEWDSCSADLYVGQKNRNSVQCKKQAKWLINGELYCTKHAQIKVLQELTKNL
jgi:hypothetical protein